MFSVWMNMIISINLYVIFIIICYINVVGWLQVESVRAAVKEENVSDDRILDVLQCYDFNVDQTVTAFHEGLIPANYIQFDFISFLQRDAMLALQVLY